MIYLDYSATTKTRKEVLETFVKTTTNVFGNSNSLHQLGSEAKQLEKQATNQIASLLKVKPNEIIYTSGASESNNTAIKGVAYRNQNKGKHILTTNLEHSSIYGPLGFLQKQGFIVEFIPTNENGQIEIDTLKTMIREDTILVTIASVNSETGLKQPIEAIGQFLQNYPKCVFHVDMTQSIGKVPIDTTYVDLFSFSAHKFYGMKGIGCLVKKEHVQIEPLIHGGKSTTPFRSGTPALPLIVSLAKALRLILEEQEQNYHKVKQYQETLIKTLQTYEGVTINHNDFCIPHILNISVLNSQPETFLHALEQQGIYISTQSACSSGKGMSQAVKEFTKDETIASHSLRISLSGMTTETEIDSFLKAFHICYEGMLWKN